MSEYAQVIAAGILRCSHSGLLKQSVGQGLDAGATVSGPVSLVKVYQHPVYQGAI